MEYKIEFISISELKPHPKNYNSHPEDQIPHLVESLKVNGLYKNIVISSDNYILSGHGVLTAMKEIQEKEVPVFRLPFKHDDPKALKVIVGDNEINKLSEKDDRLLSEILKDIKEMDETGLIGTGFDEMMLANLVFITRNANEIKDIDEAKHWVGMPDFEPNLKPLQIIVSFENKEDRKNFGKLLNIKLTEKTKSIWFPFKEKDDVKSIKFDA